MDLLVVEDDPIIGRALRQGFTETGDECVWAKDGERGLELARTRLFDAIILDLMLPKRDGLDVIRSLRRAKVPTPILALTALGAVEERVAGLKAGADDYLVKPFAFAELKARIEALCRRSVLRPSPKLQAGALHLDLTTRRVTRGDRDIDLSPTEFSLLEFLMRHAGQLVTRKMICEHMWESDWESVTNVIEVYVNRLRGKLDGGRESSVIQTVRGRGYVLRDA